MLDKILNGILKVVGIIVLSLIAMYLGAAILLVLAALG